MKIVLAGSGADPGGSGTIERDLLAWDRITARYDTEKLKPQHLNGMDCLLFVRSPYPRDYNLVHEAKARGLLVAMIPDATYLPKMTAAGWIAQVDLMYATSKWAAKHLRQVGKQFTTAGVPCAWTENIQHGYWGVDLQKAEFEERAVCRRLLLLNGTTGLAYRTGSYELAMALADLAERPVSVVTRPGFRPHKQPAGVELIEAEISNLRDLYREGDVLLALSKYTGFGLSVLEAQACGLPVVANDTGPYPELGPVRKLRTSESFMVLMGQKIETAAVDTKHLASTIKDLIGKNIQKGSQIARAYAQKHHDLRHALETLWNTLETAVNHRGETTSKAADDRQEAA